MQLSLFLVASGLLNMAVSTSNPYFCPTTTIGGCCKTVALGAEGASTATGVDCTPLTSPQPSPGGGLTFNCPASYIPTCCGVIVTAPTDNVPGTLGACGPVQAPPGACKYEYTCPPGKIASCCNDYAATTGSLGTAEGTLCSPKVCQKTNAKGGFDFECTAGAIPGCCDLTVLTPSVTIFGTYALCGTASSV